MIEELLAARARLAHRKQAEILALIETVVDRWLEPASPWRARAIEALAAETGLCRPMLEGGLVRQLEPLRGEAVARLLDEEIGIAVGRGRPTPQLVVHVLPGNVPALAAGAICLSLAVRAAVLIKPAAEERSFAPLFADSLAEIDADLAACVAVRYWAGGDVSVERAVFAAADAVDASGSDESIEAMRCRVKGRFVGRGSRLSLAAIGREVIGDAPALEAAAVALAEDVAIWEQRGCLSPQTLFVETTSSSALARVAEAVLAALDERAVTWPRHRLSLDESAAVARFLQSVEWGLHGEGGARVLRGRGGALVVDDLGGEAPPRHAARSTALQTCLHRTVRVRAVGDLASLPEVVRASGVPVEAVGLAVDEAELHRSLQHAGVSRVCRLGEMQRPDLSWKPGGVPRVAAWFR